MKSRFFRDARELDALCERREPDKLCVCLRLSKRAMAIALERSERLGISSGEYIERLLTGERAEDEGEHT